MPNTSTDVAAAPVATPSDAQRPPVDGEPEELTSSPAASPWFELAQCDRASAAPMREPVAPRLGSRYSASSRSARGRVSPNREATAGATQLWR